MAEGPQTPDWDRIENFIGYGRPDAPVVFLGMEEGLRRDADLLVDLTARSSFEPYMDLVEAQTELDGPVSYFGKSPKAQKTWRPMCHLMLCRDRNPSPTLEQRNRYQADRLGRRNGDTLLIELLPYPHSDTGQWLYDRFDRFRTRDEYEAKLISRRIALLKKVLRQHPRELIVAYGKANWPKYKVLFEDVRWQRDGKFEFGTWGSSHVVLAHQLAGKQFNTDAQLQRFAAVALATGPVRPAGVKEEQVTSIGSQVSLLQAGNLAFRRAFGEMAFAYRNQAGLSPEAVSDQARSFAGQGNPGGVRNLERSNGWVNPKFAEGVFRATGVPNAEQFGAAYAILKKSFNGVTRERD